MPQQNRVSIRVVMLIEEPQCPSQASAAAGGRAAIACQGLQTLCLFDAALAVGERWSEGMPCGAARQQGARGAIHGHGVDLVSQLGRNGSDQLFGARTPVVGMTQSRGVEEIGTVQERCVGINDGNANTACLLYTSPSPRDLSTTRMPSSA